MEGLRKIEYLIEEQKKRRDLIFVILQDFLKDNLKIDKQIKIKIDFYKNNLIKIKILENSSLKYTLLQNKNIFINKYKDIFKQDIIFID